MMTSLRFLTAAAVVALGVAATSSPALAAGERGGDGGRDAGREDRCGKDVVALTGTRTLLLLNNGRGRGARRVEVTNIAGELVGIDVRPADGLLYGLVRNGTVGQVVTVDPRTGVATLRSILSVPLPAGVELSIDFNPVVDRLRIVGADGTNLRANADSGETLVDGRINYAQPNPPLGGTTPGVVGVAYTNSRPGTVTATTLYAIDDPTDALYQQQPPNAGTLVPVGRLGLAVGAALGFDIAADRDGGNCGLVASGDRLFRIDIETGAVIDSRRVGGVDTPLRDVAVLGR